MQHPLAENVSIEQRAQHDAGGDEPRGDIPDHVGLPTDALDYDLPAERIATYPVEPRDAARMLVLWRGDEARIEHRHVRDLPEYLNAGDALVFNNTMVAPARLEMRRATGGRVEGLFLQEKRQNVETSKRQNDDLQWIVMLRSGGRVHVGESLTLLDREDQPTTLVLRVVDHVDDQWKVAVESDDVGSSHDILACVGRTPLPPYILQARHEQHEAYREDEDRQWYQTVFADASLERSVAAPTAGLHFTPELLKRIEAIGVRRIEVTLHVGPGTFKPVTSPTVQQHRMHSEWFEVSEAALRALAKVRNATTLREHPHPQRLSPATAVRERGERIIAVGTTTVRTLESLPADALDHERQICGPIRGMTDLLIVPPHRFRHVDGLLTNFHLPRSTLLALVAAMVEVGGLERLLNVYREAIKRGYRFYSYGDAMLILP